MASERPRLYRPREASDYLKSKGVIRAHSTLAKLRVVGTGPEFVKIGNRDVAYPEPGLDAYADSLISRPMRSTGEVT